MRTTPTPTLQYAIQERLQALKQMDRDALVTYFEQVFNVPPPRRSRQTLLKLALGWHLQMQAQHQAKGKRPQTPIQHLKAMGKLLSGTNTTRTIFSGARLIREWKGVTHEVEVIDGGFRYQGQDFKSLSAIAKTITGTPWSGPVFFGLKSATPTTSKGRRRS